MNKKAFTLVELVIAISILAILSTIGMISYLSYLSNARDTQRKTDISQLSSALRLQKQQKGGLPMPGGAFNLVYGSSEDIVAYQGKINSDVSLSSIDRLPLDPLTKNPYVYSITSNKQEYQIAATLENSDSPYAIVEGSYKTVSVNLLPSIILAVENTPGTNANIQTLQNSFVLSDQDENLPYSLEQPYTPVAESTSIANLVTRLKSENLYWQNSDFRTCEQIKEAGKDLGRGTAEYQIINENGILTNTNCTFD